MNDAVDGVMEDDEEESEEIMNRVLEEIGIELGSSVFFLDFFSPDLLIFHFFKIYFFNFFP